MTSLVHYRILGYTATLMMHGINSLIMLYNLHDKRLMKDPKLQELESMNSNFFTIWNILFQLIYAGAGLTCDVLTLMKRDHLLPKPVKKLKDTLFEAIVAPGTFTVLVVFWPFFLTNRELVFPSFIDKLFSPYSNMVMHLGILPVVLWEMAFQPKLEPKSHRKNLTIYITYSIIYLMKIHYVFYQRGLYPYPIMHKLQGTLLFYILHIVYLFLLIGTYYLQWWLVKLFWGSESVKNKGSSLTEDDKIRINRIKTQEIFLKPRDLLRKRWLKDELNKELYSNRAKPLQKNKKSW